MNNLKRLFMELGYSQKEVSEYTGINVSRINRICNSNKDALDLLTAREWLVIKNHLGIEL